MLQTSTCINVTRPLKGIINQITTVTIAYRLQMNLLHNQMIFLGKNDMSARLAETFAMNLLVIVAAILMMRNTVDNLKTKIKYKSCRINYKQPLITSLCAFYQLHPQDVFSLLDVSQTTDEGMSPRIIKTVLLKNKI